MSTSLLTQVTFYDDVLDAYRDGEDVWVSVRRVSEAIGVSVQGQHERLKTVEWAVIKQCLMTGPDGKNYEVSAISLDSLPMWLANIHASKVKPEVRPKLVRYQKECAKVLRDHFFGRTSYVAYDPRIERLERQVEQLIGAMANTVASQVELQKLCTSLAGVVSTFDQRVEARIKEDCVRAAVRNIGAWEVCEEAKVPAKGRNGYLRRVSQHLVNYCAMTGHTVLEEARPGNRKGRKLFPREAVDGWLRERGTEYLGRVRALLVARESRQITLPIFSLNQASNVPEPTVSSTTNKPN